MTDAWSHLTLGLYGAASLLYLAHVVRLQERMARAARWVLAAAFVAHLGVIGAQCLRGVHPVAGIAQSLSLLAWALVGGFLAATWRYRIAALGALIAPTTLILLIVARPAAAAPAGSMRLLGEVHVLLATIGVAAFTLAAAAGALYLLQESQLKRHRFGALFHRAPPLAALDDFGHRAVTVGFPIFTIAILTGVIWLSRLDQRPMERPQLAVSLVAWLAFAALLVARLTAGWRGRRAAILTLLGFSTSAAAVGFYVARALGG